ncbi:MAG: hypothetical protein DSM107014_12345 [Gomphosphaeria aponina SAG 52.96 = DSM 107014]|uniref:Uncharacterized protein n=1 Tax=Gomphosphaeria aponina SAG 52.96 = DSM 107014 TaxID=1521640 RepID=A0A941GYK5_9CHRO|nr:hypothetical protein [Gomphosphaeria aponina SAG 52.96 = DSM 107014]
MLFLASMMEEKTIDISNNYGRKEHEKLLSYAAKNEMTISEVIRDWLKQ